MTDDLELQPGGLPTQLVILVIWQGGWKHSFVLIFVYFSSRKSKKQNIRNHVVPIIKNQYICYYVLWNFELK